MTKRDERLERQAQALRDALKQEVDEFERLVMSDKPFDDLDEVRAVLADVLSRFAARHEQARELADALHEPQMPAVDVLDVDETATFVPFAAAERIGDGPTERAVPSPRPIPSRFESGRHVVAGPMPLDTTRLQAPVPYAHAQVPQALSALERDIARAIEAIRSAVVDLPDREVMLEALRRAQQQARRVAAAPLASATLDRDEYALALVQSAMSEARPSVAGDARPMDLFGARPYEFLDVKWIKSLREFLMARPVPFPSHVVRGTAPPLYTIEDDAVIALAGDWGTGNASSVSIGNRMRELAPHHTIHLGDVYYSGAPDEERRNFVALWPSGSASPPALALNSNHEMYSGGDGYFNIALADAKFAAQHGLSYFALQNANWLVVGLDTAYHGQLLDMYQTGVLDPDVQLRFLRDIASSRGSRRIILLTHHNGLDLHGNPVQPLWNQVLGALDGGPDYWYWGHVHAAAVYKPVAPRGRVVRARCAGHGGIPYAPLEDTREALEWTETQLADDSAEPRRALNGFVGVGLSGPALTETFYDERGRARWTSTQARARPAAMNTGSVASAVGEEFLGIINELARSGAELPTAEARTNAALEVVERRGSVSGNLLTTKRERYIIGSRTARLSASASVRAPLETVANMLPNRLHRSTNSGAKVVDLSPLEAALIRDRYGSLLVQPDRQYHICRSPHYDDIEPIAVPATGGVSSVIRVTDPSGNAVADARVVALVQGKRGFDVRTDARGVASFRAMSSRFAQLVIFPRHTFWSRKLVGFESAGAPPIVVDPLPLAPPAFRWGQMETGAASRGSLRGSEIRVAIIDSGIAPHDGLPPVERGGPIAGGQNFVTGENPATSWTDDLLDHGTHCAGVVAATASAATWGYAPNVSLFALRVFGATGVGGFESDIADAIDWAVANRCDIVSMSLGLEIAGDYLRLAIEHATNAGVLCVAAAGNDGRRDGVLYPARFPHVVGVSAVGKKASGFYPVGSAHEDAESAMVGNDNYYLAAFSNSGPGVALCGPGVGIMSTVPQRGNAYSAWDGTSMACPHITGIAALALEALPWVRAATGATRVNLLTEVLTRSARDLGLATDLQGAGLPQIATLMRLTP